MQLNSKIIKQEKKPSRKTEITERTRNARTAPYFQNSRQVTVNFWVKELYYCVFLLHSKRKKFLRVCVREQPYILFINFICIKFLIVEKTKNISLKKIDC